MAHTCPIELYLCADTALWQPETITQNYIYQSTRTATNKYKTGLYIDIFASQSTSLGTNKLGAMVIQFPNRVAISPCTLKTMFRPTMPTTRIGI